MSFALLLYDQKDKRPLIILTKYFALQDFVSVIIRTR